MAFTTPCFVRVEDAAERKKLIEWLKGIGYNITGRLHGDYIIAAGGKIYVAVIVCASKPFIDAGTNVEFFRALSAMNDENDKEQWFTDGAGNFVHNNADKEINDVLSFAFYLRYGEYPHKATAEEIVEYFKKR